MSGMIVQNFELHEYLKWFGKVNLEPCVKDSSGWGHGQVAGLCEYGTDPLLVSQNVQFLN